MSPAITSTSPRTGDSSSQPRDPVDVYRTSARVRAPSATSRSVRWLSMKPPAPVTRTRRPFHALTSDLAFFGVRERPRVVVRPSDVQPVLPEWKAHDAKAGGDHALDEIRHVAPLAARHETTDVAVQEIDAGVDERSEHRFLVHVGHDDARRRDDAVWHLDLERAHGDGHVGAVGAMKIEHRDHAHLR